MKNKISSKIILCVVVCSVLISAVVGITAIKVSTSEIKEEAYGKILNMAASRGNEYSIEIKKTENTVKEYAQVISDNIDISKVKDADYMDAFQNQFASLTKSIGISNRGIVGLYINFNPDLTGGSKPYDLAYYCNVNTGIGEICYNSYTKEDYYESNKEMAWYYNPIKANKGVWSKPYVDPESDNINMVSYTMPVYKDDKLLGVVGLDISFENLKKMIMDTDLYYTGSAFLLDNDYTFIVDKDRTAEDNLGIMEGGKYNNVVEDIKNKKESVIEVNFQGKESVIGYYTLDNGQIIGVRVPTEEVLKSMNDLVLTMIIVISVGIILSTILGSYISRKISMPVETATDFMERLAKLDLTVSEYNLEKMILNKDETGLMIKSLIHQRDELLKIVKVLKKNSIKVLNDTDIISTAENETVESISMISNVMEQLLERASEQAREVIKGSFKLSALADKVEESVKSIAKLEKNSIEMEKIQEDGSRSLEELSKEVKRNIRAVINGSDSVDDIIINSNLAEELIGTIRELSKEANDLIRETSTEIEKSEENIKDSERVKKIIKLTEKAAEFASKAQDLLINIQKELRINKKNMESSNVQYHEVNEIMGISIEAFKGIGKATDSTMKQVENIAIIINELNKDKDEVLESFEEISMLTEEVAVSVENVTANIAEQEVAMKSTSERTTELKKVSEALGDVVGKFKI